jgi:uncharacterized damage-inducible protein DinB
MISAEHLADSFARNIRILKMQTEGISHEESLIQLPFRANSLNWILGHLVTNRYHILKLLDAEYLIDPISVERYERDSEPITPDSSDALPLEQLMRLLEGTQSAIARRLGEIPDEGFQRRLAFFSNTEMTVGEWLLFFYFHDSYHTGQTEIMRQAAGKDDKII